MAADIVPALLEAIEIGYRGRMEVDKRLIQVDNRIRDGTATLADGHTYAERLGVALSNALLSEIRPDTLPNGELYFNIANRVIPVFLRDIYDSVNLAAADIQHSIDKRSGIGINPAKAGFPQKRIDGLIDKLTDQEEVLEDRLRWLDEPIVNNAEAFFDDYIAENAETRANMGLKTTITRIVAPGCCQWCAALAGTYEYGDEPKDVYLRHEYCRCTVTYDSVRGSRDIWSQDVWSKKQWQSTPEELAARRSAGLQMRG